MIARVRASRLLAGMCAAAAIAGSVTVVGGAGDASAVQVYQGQRYVTVWLSHAETQQAAQIGLGRFFDQPAVKSRSTVFVRRDSQFYPLVTPGAQGHSKYSGSAQALVVEAASKPGGQVAVYIDKARPDRPIGVSQYWPTR